MSSLRERMFSRTRRYFIALSSALALVMPGMVIAAGPEDIPHENFDLVGTNLDFVIALLNSSIDYSERALMAMYNRSMGYVEENLSVVRNILVPADRLVGEIEDVASSYENLSTLLPPFVALSSKEDSFSSMESRLLVAVTKIVSASELENLTGEERLAAIEAIMLVNQLVQKMNSTIDGMLVDAVDITGTVVDGKTPFADNDLVPLIEKLRDLLQIVLLEVENIIQHGVPWGETEPFLLLWLNDDRYYLGEEIQGGGYLYFNGSFVPSHLVNITIDGEPLTSSTTAAGGRFSFAYAIPVNASWAGTHAIQATADTPWETLYSDALAITISLIPTALTLTSNTKLMSIEDTLELKMTLREVHGLPMVGSAVRLSYDASEINLTTDAHGSCVYALDGRELGYGSHSFQAFYDGELPYAGSSSGRITVVIDIPTRVDLVIFADRLREGMYLVGNGYLYANATQPLAGQTITLLVDGTEALNVTTGADGKFSYTIETEGMRAGTHTLTAAFLHRESVWRYSEAELGFTIYTLRPGEYPFWPHFPGWGGMFPDEEFPYLFFGEYAYITWLVIIALIALVIRLLQMRSQRKLAAERAKALLLEPIEKPTPGRASEADAGEFVAGLASEKAVPSTPNERIVWYYRALLNFLTSKRGIGLRESMTHWEVARFLRVLGYPQAAVEAMTLLFERALYSGAALTDDDTVVMSSTLTQLVSARRVTTGAA